MNETDSRSKPNKVDRERSGLGVPVPMIAITSIPMLEGIDITSICVRGGAGMGQEMRGGGLIGEREVTVIRGWSHEHEFNSRTHGIIGKHKVTNDQARILCKFFGGFAAGFCCFFSGF